MEQLISLAGSLVLILIACSACASTPLGPGCYERIQERRSVGDPLRYQLFVPEAAPMPEEGWPLLLFLHGAGERGDDLTRLAVHGPTTLVGSVPELSRCVVLAPQCAADSWWLAEGLGALVEEVLGLVTIDSDRVYVTGISMGGFGTWALLARYPDRFAAAVPICGGGDANALWSEVPSDFRLEDLRRARHVPVRAFHGAEDEVVPLQSSQELVDALQTLGGDATLTVYPGVAHDSWTRTYQDPELYRWLFAQRRGSD